MLFLSVATLLLVRPLLSHSTKTSIFTAWSGWGSNLHNNRRAPPDTLISSTNVESLTTHCQITYPTGVSATPVISGSVVYYPTINGSFVSLDYVRCRVLWQINVTAIIESHAPITSLQASLMNPISRTSPQLDEDNDVLYFGTLANALLVAVDVSTGATLGLVQVNTHPVAVVTMSPTLYHGRVFVGSSSYEANATPMDGYVCCSFVGNFLAASFDRLTRKFTVHWDIPMVPAAQAASGWSGAGVWGSQPAIDASRNQVFVGSGQMYSIPEVILECQSITQGIRAVLQGLVPNSCLPVNIWQESILAIDVELGVVNWAHQLSPLDAWVAACGVPGIFPVNKTQCPYTPGPDADFGMAPTFVPGSEFTPQGRDTLVVGQKNGNLYALSAETGYGFWTTTTSPGGNLGGLSWGIAVDESRVYYTAINSMRSTFQLLPRNQTTDASTYGAASLGNGTILWQIPVPGEGGVAYGPPTVAGDLVLVAKTGSDPNATGRYDGTVGSLVTIEKTTGTVVDVRELDSNFHGGVAVQRDYVFFGTGYHGLGKALANGSIHVWRLSP